MYLGNQILATSTLQSVYVGHVQKSITEEVDKIDIDPDLVNPVLGTPGAVRAHNEARPVGRDVRKLHVGFVERELLGITPA